MSGLGLSSLRLAFLGSPRPILALLSFASPVTRILSVFELELKVEFGVLNNRVYAKIK
jgi:hypothetical protein